MVRLYVYSFSYKFAAMRIIGDVCLLCGFDFFEVK